MIFNPKRGGQFFDIPPPPTPSQPQKSGFQVVGSRASGPKTQGGMHFLDKIMILQGVQPIEVGYANSPKKAQKGGYVVFSPIYGLAWL